MIDLFLKERSKLLQLFKNVMIAYATQQALSIGES